MRKNLTAILVVHDEEKIIERAVKSIKKVTNRIIIVHDGVCKDKTLDICRKYKCDIYTKKATGEAEIHRAWSYGIVKTEWVLQIDADEYLSDELVKNIDKLIDNKKVDCWELLWPYFDGKKYRTKTWPYKKALFRKDKISFLALPHEEVVVKGVIKRTKLRLNHEPEYDNFSINRFKTKHQKWIEIHARYLLTDPKKYDRYPKNNKLKPHYYFIIGHPLLCSVPLFFYHFTASLLLGGIREGWYGFRNSLVQSYYYFCLCLKIYQLKRNGYKEK